MTQSSKLWPSQHPPSHECTSGAWQLAYILMVTAYFSHVIVIYKLHSWLLTTKVNEDAGRKLWICGIMLNDC